MKPYRRLILTSGSVLCLLLFLGAGVIWYYNRQCVLEDAYINDLRFGDWPTQVRAASRLGKMGSVEAVPDLVRLLELNLFRHSDDTRQAEVLIEEYRDWYARSTGRIAQDHKLKHGDYDEEPPTLLADYQVFAKSTVIMALEEIGPDAKEAIPVLVKCLKDVNTSIRCLAAGAIGAIGEGSDIAVPVLIQLLNDRSRLVRKYAARALGSYGPKAQAGISALRDVLNDEYEDVRKAADCAINRIAVTD